MATLAQIREGLAVRARTVVPRASAYMEPNPQPPMLCVVPRNATYGVTFTGNVTYTFDLWLYVNKADIVRAQEELDQYMAPAGPASINAAVSVDQTLGGIVEYCKVIGWENYAHQMDVGGTQVLGASLQVEVGAL